MTRRRALILSALTLVLGGVAATGQTVPAVGTVVEGRYLGHWHDGRPLHETIRVIGPDLITMERHGSSALPVPFHRTAPGIFTSASGSTLTVVTPTRLLWTDGAGGAIVTYRHD